LRPRARSGAAERHTEAPRRAPRRPLERAERERERHQRSEERRRAQDESESGARGEGDHRSHRAAAHTARSPKAMAARGSGEEARLAPEKKTVPAMPRKSAAPRARCARRAAAGSKVSPAMPGPGDQSGSTGPLRHAFHSRTTLEEPITRSAAAAPSPAARTGIQVASIACLRWRVGGEKGGAL